jgi:uncharacterized SAM-binding protein YcdF (DUF218 family)
MMPATPRGHGYLRSQRGGIFFRLLFLICFLFLVFLVYVARHPLLRLAGSFWVVDEGPAAADAIVMLGDDNYPADRATRAAEVIKAGWAPRVIASGRYLRPYVSIAELEERDLVERGVPPSAVVRFAHHAESTRDEALALSELISSKGWKRIIVVTSNFHTRRARYICARAFPPGTALRVVAARDSDFDPDNWWQTRLGVNLFAHELVGMVVAIWEMRHQVARTISSIRLPSAQRVVAKLCESRTLPVYSELQLYYILDTLRG